MNQLIQFLFRILKYLHFTLINLSIKCTLIYKIKLYFDSKNEKKINAYIWGG